MINNDDWQLLQQFVQTGSQSAFARLVDRYFRLIHGRCLRQLGDAHSADDVTQAVFLVLAKRAAGLTADVPLIAWLYRVALFACQNEIKMRNRRRRHETASAATRAQADVTNAEVTALTPLLDAAIDRLGTLDRQAVLLRYFENRSVSEVAASLGMTENTAGRRLLRAITKLRSTFASHGVKLPAAAIGSAISGVLLATAAPSARAAVGPATHTAAHTILRSLRWAIWKPLAIAAIMFITIGGSVATWVAVNRPTQTAATAIAPVIAVITPTPSYAQAADQDSTEVHRPGVAQLCQWDLLLNEAGDQSLQGIGHPIDSPSKLYQARLCDAAQLRRAIADAIGSEDVAAVSHQSRLVSLPQMVFDGKLDNPQFAPQYTVTTPGNFIWFFSSSQSKTDKFDRLNGAIRLHLDHPDMNAGIADEPRRNLIRPRGGSGIAFDGQIAPGQTLTFIAPFTAQSGAVYYHLIAWEAFQATPAEVACMDFPTDAGWWCQHGPDQLRLWADEERIWSNQTGWGRPLGAPSIERKLSTGESVWLFALSRPSDYPFCWWDPHGKPAPPGQGSVPFNGSPPTGLWAQIGVSNPTPSPWKPADDDGNGEQETPGNPMECQQIDPAKPLQIGVPIGPWTEITRLKYDKPVTVGGVQYSIVPDPENPQYWAKFTRIGVLDDQLHVIAVHLDGTKHRFEVQRPLQWTAAGISQTVTQGAWSDGSPGTIDYFSIRLRKREFVTFDAFAGTPSTKPPSNLTREQTDAELSRITKEHLQQCLDQLPKLRGKYFLSWLTRKDPTWYGGMQSLLGAALSHDEPTVQKNLSATTKPATDALDALAHLIVRGEMIRTAVSSRFGESAAHELLDQSGLFEDLEAELMAANWAGMMNAQPHLHPFADMETFDSWLPHLIWQQGPSGDYTLVVDDLFQSPDAMDQLNKRCRLADEVYQRVSDKQATLDEIKHLLPR